MQRASSSVVVNALASFELDVSNLTVGLDEPCGRLLPSSPVNWLLNLLPFTEHEWRALYLYVPTAHAWDCYGGETPLRVNDAYRSPCVCQPPRDPSLVRPVLRGALVGVLFPAACLVLGVCWDCFERGSATRRAIKWKEHSWRLRVAIGACLHVIDHGTDIAVVYHFYAVGLYSYLGEPPGH